MRFHPGMSSQPMVKCLLLFTRFCGDEISSINITSILLFRSTMSGNALIKKLAKKNDEQNYFSKKVIV